MSFWALLLHWALVVGGLIYLISRSYIFGPLRSAIGRLSLQYASLVWRNWVRILIYCPACIGFWIGVCATPLWPYDGFGRPLGSGIAAMLLGSLLAEYWSSALFEIEGEWWGDPPNREDDDDEETQEESERSDD